MGAALPSSRLIVVLHVALVAPLVALAVWFGLVDRLPFGEGRCSSCGVEGYVIAVHVAAAAAIGAVVAAFGAVRRQLAVGIRAPGPATVAGLSAAAVALAASLIWRELFELPGIAALLVGVVAVVPAAVWWLYAAVTWLRRPPRSDVELRARLTAELVAAWAALVVFLPALYVAVWLDRVEWLTF